MEIWKIMEFVVVKNYDIKYSSPPKQGTWELISKLILFNVYT